MRPQAQQPPLANGGPALQQGSMPGPRPTYGAPPMVPAGFQRGPPGLHYFCAAYMARKVRCRATRSLKEKRAASTRPAAERRTEQAMTGDAA